MNAHPAGRSDRGSVTAELAVALTGLIPLLLLVTGLVAVLLAQLAVTGAATTGARLLARGEDRAVVEAMVLRAAGHGADLTVTGSGGLTRVRVSRAVPVLGAVRVPVAAESVVPTELAGPAAGAGSLR